MKAVVCERFGEPSESLSVKDVPSPECGAGQAMVRMLASPVNPSDLMTVRGVYGRRPSLPFTPGYEGVGVVEEAKGWLAWFRGLKGKRVAVLNGTGGNWAERVAIPSRQAVPLPDSIPDEQAASFFVNPASAIVMTRHVLRVPRGAWLLQTAAGSMLGRMVIRLGKRNGFKTVNLVRRREQVAELRALGADEVLVLGEDAIPQAVRSLSKDGVGHALDCVGGAMGSEAVKCLGPKGRLLLYGTLSGEPISFDPRLLMVGGKRIEGFWLSEWVQTRGPLAMLSLFGQIDALMREGVLATETGTAYPMAQVADAVREAEKPGRGGKVMLRLGTR
ncbi:MAG: zinc-dependent alcohol dehydrogenase family protein [Gemmataceae bacterium]|nr:zinc-dependent alcohol dehydrogenase family protein [Gemmataceae bacterium]